MPSTALHSNPKIELTRDALVELSMRTLAERAAPVAVAPGDSLEIQVSNENLDASLAALRYLRDDDDFVEIEIVDDASQPIGEPDSLADAWFLASDDEVIVPEAAVVDAVTSAGSWRIPTILVAIAAVTWLATLLV